MDQITIEKLTVFGNHGVYPEENKLGQKFLVSLVLYTDTRKAGMSDELESSINYGDVSQYVRQFFEENTFKLIERVAEKLAEGLLLRYSLLEKVDVKIEKPWAPIAIPVESVGVEISRGWHRAYIALGSNMGDKHQHLQQALERLQQESTICDVKVSDFVETEPYGYTDQDMFLNAAVSLRTIEKPEGLLRILQNHLFL